MSPNEGVSEMSDVNTLVSLQIQIARIEEMLKPIGAIVPTVNDVKETSRQALDCAQQLKTKLDGMEIEFNQTKITAEEALRKATAALEAQAAQAESQKWFKRTFYAAVIVASTGGLCAAVWAGIKLAAVG
ncbi:hypothetical protein BK126_02925 [Paenibacillus sp. FSL H7-0326]|uniref:hypothetical protein n=1 Tax=Paenibacillus sp. FSL H7-0326 TaxID=1921144 RepID=UPI00096E972E|nr:hypothetical protein [Paenibacillus sp. FSL H7-0326]OMC71080.1 hypothetical protein BK126_02925 [Paenibacillus sp. FSL H7-0326]